MRVTVQAPPDGFYWFASDDPREDLTIVKVERTTPWATDIEPEVQVWFIGTDVERRWEELAGLFVPVARPSDGIIPDLMCPAKSS
jgi:hypothetical protein